jgi:VanZ family protein
MSRDVIRWGCAVVTAAYAVVLVYATHHPQPDDLLPGISSIYDKLLHVAAYGVLGCLATATLFAWGQAPRAATRPGPFVIWPWFVTLALFAACDEATQPFFRRAADPLDWVADCLGLAVGMLAAGLAAAAVRRAASRRRSPASR